MLKVRSRSYAGITLIARAMTRMAVASDTADTSIMVTSPTS